METNQRHNMWSMYVVCGQSSSTRKLLLDYASQIKLWKRYNSHNIMETSLCKKNLFQSIFENYTLIFILYNNILLQKLCRSSMGLLYIFVTNVAPSNFKAYIFLISDLRLNVLLLYKRSWNRLMTYQNKFKAYDFPVLWSV